MLSCELHVSCAQLKGTKKKSQPGERENSMLAKNIGMRDCAAERAYTVYYAVCENIVIQ